MLRTIANIWKIEDLRRKVFYTLGMIAVFRMGSYVPIPFVDLDKVADFFSNKGQGLFSMVDMFTGGGFSRMTVMAIGIMPYISAQIILQLLQVAVPRLEKLKREGEAGQKKFEQYTRYGTVGLAAFQGMGLGILMIKSGLVSPAMQSHPLIFLVIASISITAGTTLLMWIGERITENGIGNGISLIIALGIMADYPGSLVTGYLAVQNDSMAKIWVPVVAGMCIGMTILIILVQEGARKIPIQHARRTVGRRVQQATTNYLPLKVNTAGVIPVIFSTAILTLPQTFLSWVGRDSFAFGGGLGVWFSPYSPQNLYNLFGLQKESIFLLLKVANLYTLLYIVLTGFFCFFYTAVMFNPHDVADNLKKSGAFIPGYRPGKQTADYIDMVLTRITTVGALFLIVVALVPQFLTTAFDVQYQVANFAGGTGLIIVVGVVLDTMKRVESQLLMRHYDGFRIRRQAGAGGRGEGRRWAGRSR